MEDIADSRPSGRILENYNRKKKASDHDMPCIKVEEPCPCWKRVELDNILGQHSGGDSYDADYCWEFDESPWQIYTAIGEYGGNIPYYDIWAIAWEWGPAFAHRDDYCQSGEYVEGQGYRIRTKDVAVDELLACRDQIRERYAAVGVSAAQCIGDL